MVGGAGVTLPGPGGGSTACSIPELLCGKLTPYFNAPQCHRLDGMEPDLREEGKSNSSLQKGKQQV